MSNDRTFVDSILKSSILSHVIFWCLYLLFSTTLATLNEGDFVEELIKYSAVMPSQLIAAYLLIHFQVPKFSLRKKYISFFGSLILSGYLLSAFARFCIVHIAEPLYRKDFEQETILEILSDVSYLFGVYFPLVYGIAFILLIVHILKKRAEEQQQIQILQKEKATNELKFLKAQIQPHFLFNTLNNLYALTLSKSDLAPKVVLKLSEILDFILYQSNQSEISIEKEIELIESFIELEMLRYGDLLDIEFHHKIDDTTSKIAPLLLLPFVENAFKHGAAGNLENPTIKIDLTIENKQLKFQVYNNKPKVVSSIKETMKGGIGTQNLKRQLELNYSGEYDLDVENTEEAYQISLTIDLK